MERSEDVKRLEHLDDVKRRLNQVLYICAAMFLTALVAVILSVGVLYSDKQEFNTLTRTSYELTRRNNRLRAEQGLNQARLMALRGELRKLGREDVLTAIQQSTDRHATAELRNGTADDKTQDDVRREACAALEADGLGPCAP
jgi:hypothetical protein